MKTRLFSLLLLPILVAFPCLAQSNVLPTWQSILSDRPQEHVRLLSSWRLQSNTGVDIASTRVPGDLWSDLMQAGLIDDPYYDRNFLTQRHVWMGNISTPSRDAQLEQRTATWTYSAAVVENDHNETTTAMLLVAEGIKMGAKVTWNDDSLGTVTDQFLRYIFPLPANGQQRQLKIHFDPDISTDGRFMGCSGGWDWAPYTQAGDGARGSRVGTLGLVKPIYVVPVDAVYVHAVVPRVYYQGKYPQEPLLQGPEGDFLVQVEVHVRLLRDVEPDRYFVNVRSDFADMNETYRVPVAPDEFEQVVQVDLVASKDDIKLWWPNGMGDQPLYHVEVSLEDAMVEYCCRPWIRKRIGFRIAALVTSDDTNSTQVQQMLNSEGSGNIGMFFRVNGALVYARGANVIPMDLLEGRWSDEAHRLMVQSASAARMNMLRVWGGGAVLPESFYEACDEEGIMLYHDLMFVGEQNHSAFQSDVVRDEIRHIVRTLSSHPSIVLWSGCNECTYFGGDIEIYASFVMKTVAEEDDTRVIWPSCPSDYGWESGVNTLDGRPNGNPLTVREHSKNLLEVHGPYNHGFSSAYPGVNGVLYDNTFETNVPPHFAMTSVGPNLPNTFISEFGSSVHSSFESMSATLPKESWSLHGGGPPDTCHQLEGNINICNGTNSLAQRNYPCDSRIQAFFGSDKSFLDLVGPRAFSLQLYQCMIAQALWIKGQIEMFRSSNSYGTLIWQLNEVWPTGGWGAVEYGARRNQPQQVVGGRWKPLMYMLGQSIYQDVTVACGEGLSCYIRNDGMKPVNVRVRAEAWNINQHELVATWWWTFRQETTATTFLSRFHLPQNLTQLHADVVLLDIFDTESHDKVVETSAFLWQTPAALASRAQARVEVEWQVVGGLSNGNYQNITVQVATSGLALYVVLSTAAMGRFDSNAFHLRPNKPRMVVFEGVGQNDTIDMDLFEKSLRVDHLFTHLAFKEGSHLHPAPPRVPITNSKYSEPAESSGGTCSSFACWGTLVVIFCFVGLVLIVLRRQRRRNAWMGGMTRGYHRPDRKYMSDLSKNFDLDLHLSDEGNLELT